MSFHSHLAIANFSSVSHDAHHMPTTSIDCAPMHQMHSEGHPMGLVFHAHGLDLGFQPDLLRKIRLQTAELATLPGPSPTQPPPYNHASDAVKLPASQRFVTSVGTKWIRVPSKRSSAVDVERLFIFSIQRVRVLVVCIRISSTGRNNALNTFPG